MARRMTLVAGVTAVSVSSAAAGFPAAQAAQWDDTTVAPGATVVLKSSDSGQDRGPAPTDAGAPSRVTVANSEVLPAGWSVVSLSGEIRVSAPVTAVDGETVVLTLKDNDTTVDELKVTVDEDGDGDGPAGGASGVTSSPADGSVGESSSGSAGPSWVTVVMDRIASFFA